MTTEKQREEFELLSRPLIKFISENFHPHTDVILDSVHAEILEGVMVFHTEDYLTD